MQPTQKPRQHHKQRHDNGALAIPEAVSLNLQAAAIGRGGGAQQVADGAHTAPAASLFQS